MQWAMEMPWPKPPLNANQRLHWAAAARLKREVRAAGALIARSVGLPRGLRRVHVWIEVTPPDRRRRDPSNFMPTQKALLDGLVDYGLVPDDCPPYVQERVPVLLDPVPGRPRVVLVVDDLRQRGRQHPR